MIIKSCYIHNYGKLEDFTYDFQEGLNVIKEDNGWGKTTLASFIKSMFYGLEYSRATKRLTERKKYEPWNDGKYGGSLTFQIDNKEYKIIRTFGKTDKTDEFKLYNLATNKETTDYSMSIGEEIFGIDSDSFERSIFITLDSEEPKMSDTINAKLNNLIDNTKDINNFENAYKVLDEKAKDIKSGRSNSYLNQVDNKLININNSIRECDNARVEMDNLYENIEAVKDGQKAVEIKIDAVKNEISNIAKFAKKNEYNKFLRQKEEKLLDLQAIKTRFNEKIPREDDINKYKEKAIKLQPLLEEMVRIEERNDIESKKNLLREKFNFFDGNLPTDEGIDNCSNALNEYDKIFLKLNSNKPTDEEVSYYNNLEKKYSKTEIDNINVDRLMDNYNQVININKEIEANKSKLEHLKQIQLIQQTKNDGKLSKIMFILGTMFAVIGGVLAFTPLRLSLAIMSLITGIILIILGFIMKTKTNTKQDNNIEKEFSNLEENIIGLKTSKNKLEESYIQVIDQIDSDIDKTNILRLLSDIKGEISKIKEYSLKINVYNENAEKLNKVANDIKTNIDEFLSKYRIKTNSNDDRNILITIRQYKAKYIELKREIDEYDKLKRTVNELEEDLNPYIEEYNRHMVFVEIINNKHIDYPKTLEGIRDDYKAYTDITREINRLNDEIEELVKNKDIDLLEDIKEPNKTLMELEDEYKQLEDEKSHHIKLQASYEKRWEELSFIEEKKQDFESEKENLIIEKSKFEEKYNHLNQTIKFLALAKENLSTRYLKPMSEAFNNYLKLIDGGNIKMSIDTDLKTEIVEKGIQYRVEHLSSGYKDLVNICIRLALAEAMFETERPFLLLDDPFINLDDERLDKAMELIKSLSKDYQILYFVCQESRVID